MTRAYVRARLQAELDEWVRLDPESPVQAFAISALEDELGDVCAECRDHLNTDEDEAAGR